MAEEQEEVGSIEDRVADHFGWSDEPEEEVSGEVEESAETEESGEEVEKEGAEEESALEEIEIDGELYEVPPKLKEAFMKSSDYTQKTQEVSTQRKELETLATQLETSQKQYEFVNSIANEAGQIQMLDNQIQQYREYMKANIESLSGQDLERIRFQIEESKLQKDELTQTVQRKYQEFQQAQERSIKELRDKSTDILRQKIPKWSESVEKEIMEYGRNLGFTESQVGAARLDPRQMELVYKALAYDKLQQGKSAAVKKAGEAPAIKPKARNSMPDDAKRKGNFKKNMQRAKSEKDKAKVIEADLTRMFGG